MSQKRPDPLNVLPYATVRDSIHTGYLALVEGDGAIANIIQRRTDSPYSHVAVAGWESEGDVLMAGESTHPESRAVTLSSILRASPGRVDIYRLRPEISQLVKFGKVWEFMLRATGQSYPVEVLYHIWKDIVGLDPPHYPNSDNPETRRVCSQLAHAAFRVAGMPPMNPHDCCIYPCHWANPEWSEYLCTPVVEE